MIPIDREGEGYTPIYQKVNTKITPSSTLTTDLSLRPSQLFFAISRLELLLPHAIPAIRLPKITASIACASIMSGQSFHS
jgi:hypothetical protein